MFLSIKYDATERKFESYGLKSIISQLGLEKPNRTFYDASKIRENYTNVDEWQKIKDYCIDDADDAITLFDLMAAPFFYLTQSVPKSFQAMIEGATGSQINAIMTRAYLQDKHSIPKANEAAHYEGAISIGNVGVYSNVWKVDVASLYPSIMIEYEVGDRNKDPNGYFQDLVKTFTSERLKNKKLAKTNKYYDDLQASQKIFINSCYGFLGTAGLNFNAPEKAAFITAKGREILTKAIDWSESKAFTLVNADTDSISITNGEELSDEECTNLLIDLNSLYPDRIKWEDDGYYEKVIVLKAKNYVLKRRGEKPKYKGSAIKATLKEPRLKDFIKDIIKEIGLDRNNFIQVYNKYVKEIHTINDIKPWCTKKTITDKVTNGTRPNET
jgi:DNA polymerase elongation subunit (family B)